MFGIVVSQNISNNSVLVISAYNVNGEFEKAISYYKSLPVGQNYLTEYSVACSYYLSGDFKIATNMFLDISEKADIDVNYDLARCYARMNRPKLATEYLQKHLESKNKKTRRYIKSDTAFAGIESSEEWEQLWYNSWYADYELMYEDALYAFDNKQYDEALNILDRLNDIRKSMVDVYYLKSKIYTETGDYDNACFTINEAIEKRRKKACYYEQKAYVCLLLGKYKKALKSIDEAISIDSNRYNYYVIKTKALMMSSNIEQADTLLEQLIRIAPDYNTYKLAGGIYTQAGEYHKALKAYNKCIGYKELSSDVYIARGDLYKQIYSYDMAERDYSMALDFQPFNGELYYKRGEVRIIQGKREGACYDFHKAFMLKYIKADEMIKKYCRH